MSAELRRILCATDLGPTGARACAAAAQLSRQLDADLLLLHVFEGWEGLPWYKKSPLLSPLTDSLREKAERDLRRKEKELEAQRASLERGGARVRAKVVEGAAIWQAIVDHAALEDVDLIVVGPHDILEEGGIGESLAVRLLGSTAERVVEQADVPVLVAIAPLPERAEEEGASWPAVIGDDFSEHAGYALRYVAGLLPRLGARPVLAHVLPDFFEGRDEGEAFSRLSPELREEVSERLRTRLAEGALEGEIALLSGKASAALSRLAIERSAGLLVVASLGASALPRILLGSTSSGCLRQSSCSVLIVREPDEEERARRKASAATPTIAEKEWSFVR